MSQPKRRIKKHENLPCPFPLVSIEEATKIFIPETEEEWALEARKEKIDVNDLVHELGADGFLNWLDTSPTYCVKWAQPRTRIVKLGVIRKNYDDERPFAIKGLLREGETLNVVAPPKAGKSWMGLNIAINVIGGGCLFDNPKFQCRKGRVLIIDNELHEETIKMRTAKVALEMNCPLDIADECIHYLPLRGNLTSLDLIWDDLEHIKRGMYSVVIMDAFYKFYPEDFDENSNSAMARLYTKLDEMAESLGSSLILIHHTSKGNQTGKGVTDTGAGAGSQSRACDTHLVIREHEDPGIFVIETVNRSFAPNPAFCVKFVWPIWKTAEGYDAAMLKGSSNKATYGKKKIGGDSEEGSKKVDWKEDERKRLDEFTLEINTPMTQKDIETLGEGQNFRPWNHDRLKRILPCWIKDGLLKQVSEMKGRVAGTYISTKAKNEHPQLENKTNTQNHHGSNYEENFDTPPDHSESSPFS